MPSHIRVGLAGYGLAGRVFHAPLIATTEGLELAAVVTRDEERRRLVRRDHPGTRVVESVDDLLAGDVDLLVVATPNRTHVPLALAAIEAGVPVVVDKPLAPTAAEARQVVDTARARGVPLTVFQNRRWDGDFLTVRALMADGALGAVHRFESHYDRWRPAVRDNWRENGAPEDAGGLLFDLGAHLIDQAVQLFGPVAGVYAELDRRRPGTQTDDDVLVALRHEDGTRSQLWASVVTALPGPRFRVLGDRAAYAVDGLDGQEAALRAGHRPGGPGWGEAPESSWGELGTPGDVRRVPTRAGAYPEFYRGVEAALRTGAPMPVDPASSVYVLEVIEAALASHRTGGVVRMRAV